MKSSYLKIKIDFMKELTLEELNKMQKRASEKAIKLNEALGLSYLVVRNNKLIKVEPTGEEIIIGPSKFGTRKVQKKKIILKNTDKGG